MDSLTSVDTPQVSGGEVTSPVTADSSVSVETQPTAPTQPVEAQQQTAISGEHAATTPDDEFPDDAAFQALPGTERSSNWQRARARISELNTQNRELNERAAIAAKLEELGGLESLQGDADFTRALFSSYRQDEYGNVITNPQTGLPQITARPFIEQLQAESPDTFYTMMWEALGQPIDQNQSVGDWLLQKRYGLDPALLETYRQIQSPQDALRFNPQAVDPDELTFIPDQLHEAYKSFDSDDRADLQDLYGRDENRFLSRLRERAEYLENQKFIADARQQQAQQRELQQQQWEHRIQQDTHKLVNEKREQTVNAQLERLKTQYQPFGPDDSSGNQMVYDDVLAAADRIFDNPAIRQKAESAGNFYYQYQYYTATRNTALASRALAQADALVMELQREYAKAATVRIGEWNNRLKGRFSAAQSQPTTTTPKPQPATPSQLVNGQPRLQPQAFGISEERKRQIAAQLQLQRQGAA